MYKMTPELLKKIKEILTAAYKDKVELYNIMRSWIRGNRAEREKALLESYSQQVKETRHIKKVLEELDEINR